MSAKYTNNKELNTIMNFTPPESFEDWNQYYGMNFGKMVTIPINYHFTAADRDRLTAGIKEALRTGVPLDEDDYFPPDIDGMIY